MNTYTATATETANTPPATYQTYTDVVVFTLAATLLSWCSSSPVMFFFLT